MPSKATLVKIGAFAGLGTGLVCLVDGLLWDLLPFNQYQGIFWLTFMPLILFFMLENGKRKFILNMWLSFACGLLWGLLAIGAIMLFGGAGTVVMDVIIDLVIVGLIVFVHKGLLGSTPFNAVACVFLGFAETLGCMSTSFPIAGQLVPPMTLNGIDLIVIFSVGCIAAFAVSWFCDLLIGKFVFKGKPPVASMQDAETKVTHDQAA